MTLWSILIPTVLWREQKFLALADKILRQCENTGDAVEVVALQNAGEQSLASYRERLLAEARGTYVSFVDDDDDVPAEFVSEILAALAQEPDVVGFLQACTGTAAPLTVLSLANCLCGVGDPPVDISPWGRAYLRTYSHVCPVRAELARQATFLLYGEVYSGEDASFVHTIVPLLLQGGSREVFIDKPLYLYRWNPADTTQAGSSLRRWPGRATGHRRPVLASPAFRWCP